MSVSSAAAWYGSFNWPPCCPAVWYAPTIRLAIVLRGLLTRAMFRQALAASEACSPTESPCTLPLCLAPSGRSRPGSHSSSRFAARLIASLIAVGENPSATAAAAASAALSRPPP